jgi:hypothetical protein
MTNVAERSVPEPMRGLPQAAAVLAYAGSLPVIVGALIILLRAGDLAEQTTRLMLIYGGLLIAFFGGVRWGVAVMRPGGPSFSALIGGAVPLALAMAIFLMGSPQARFVMVLVALPALLLDDLRATRKGSGAPDWYLGVRTPLTLLMEASFLVAFITLLVR